MFFTPAGEENANAFRLDPWTYIHSPPQTPVTPLYIIVLGHAKSGKTGRKNLHFDLPFVKLTNQKRLEN